MMKIMLSIYLLYMVDQKKCANQKVRIGMISMNVRNYQIQYRVGDIYSFEDYYQRLNETNVSGCMIARGALIKPWLFTEIREQHTWDISANERFDMLKRYTNYGLEHWSSDQAGVDKTRRFFLEWISFLYRYIPVGLLERLPYRLKERPPYFSDEMISVIHRK